MGLPIRMIRTTVYVDKEVAVALRHRTAVEGRGQAALIREALHRYLEEVERAGRPPIPGIGGHRSGRTDVSDRAEELLRPVAESGWRTADSRARQHSRKCTAPNVTTELSSMFHCSYARTSPFSFTAAPTDLRNV